MKKIDNYYTIGLSFQRALITVALSGIFSGVLSSVAFVVFSVKNAELINGLGSDMTKVYFSVFWLFATVLTTILIYSFGGVDLTRHKKK